MSDLRESLKENYKKSVLSKFNEKELEQQCFTFFETTDKNSCFKLLPFYDAQKRFQEHVTCGDVSPQVVGDGSVGELYQLLEEAFNNLEQYSLNLQAKPWCKDFHIKIYTGVFKYKIEQWISFEVASKILELIGYRLKADTGYFELVDHSDERVVVVSFELYLARTLIKLFRSGNVDISKSVEHLIERDFIPKLQTKMDNYEQVSLNNNATAAVRNTITTPELKTHFDKNGCATEPNNRNVLTTLSIDATRVESFNPEDLDDAVLYGEESPVRTDDDTLHEISTRMSSEIEKLTKRKEIEKQSGHLASAGMPWSPQGKQVFSKYPEPLSNEADRSVQITAELGVYEELKESSKAELDSSIYQTPRKLEPPADNGDWRNNSSAPVRYRASYHQATADMKSYQDQGDASRYQSLPSHHANQPQVKQASRKNAEQLSNEADRGVQITAELGENEEFKEPGKAELDSSIYQTPRKLEPPVDNGDLRYNSSARVRYRANHHQSYQDQSVASLYQSLPTHHANQPPQSKLLQRDDLWMGVNQPPQSKRLPMDDSWMRTISERADNDVRLPPKLVNGRSFSDSSRKLGNFYENYDHNVGSQLVSTVNGYETMTPGDVLSSERERMENMLQNRMKAYKESLDKSTQQRQQEGDFGSSNDRDGETINIQCSICSATPFVSCMSCGSVFCERCFDLYKDRPQCPVRKTTHKYQGINHEFMLSMQGFTDYI